MKKNDIRTLTRLALLVAIELVMKAVGLGSVPVGPLYMSLTRRRVPSPWVPPQRAVLGGVFGAVSLATPSPALPHDRCAVPGQPRQHLHPLCGYACADGACGPALSSTLSRIPISPGTWSYIVSAMCAPALNTLFFMGYIVLAFYGCDYVQNLVSVKGAANPLMFVVLLVGVQGVAEFLVSGILGGIVARAVHKFLK